MKTLRPEAIKAFIVRLQIVAENLLVPSGVEEAGEKSIGSGRTEGCYTYGENSYEQFEKISNDLLVTYEWSKKYSKGFLHRKLNGILAKTIEIQSTSSIEADFPQLVAEYEAFDTEQLVITPCLGFAISSPGCLDLGRVTFRQYDQDTFKDVNDRCKRINSSRNPTEQQQKRLDNLFDSHFTKRAENKACSDFTVIAESSRATELALEETRKAITLIRYAALLSNARPVYQLTNDQLYRNENERYDIGINGDVLSENRTSICIPRDDSTIVYSSSQTSSKFVIDLTTIEWMTKVGVFVLSDILQKRKSERNNFQDVLVNALGWIDSAQTQVDDKNAFLNLMTCLETLFQVPPGGPISASISIGVSMLTCSDVSERKARKKKIADLYDLRSRLTHRGNVDFSFNDLYQLTLIVRDFMVVLIKNIDKFNSHKGFIEWLEDQKIGAPVTFPS